MIREWFIKVNGYLFIKKKEYIYEGNRTSSIIIIELRNTKSNTPIYAPKPAAYIAIASTNWSIFSSYITNRYLFCLPIYYIISVRILRLSWLCYDNCYDCAMTNLSWMCSDKLVTTVLWQIYISCNDLHYYILMSQNSYKCLVADL